jgi:hypothetical protein
VTALALFRFLTLARLLDDAALARLVHGAPGFSPLLGRLTNLFAQARPVLRRPPFPTSERGVAVAVLDRLLNIDAACRAPMPTLARNRLPEAP